MYEYSIKYITDEVIKYKDLYFVNNKYDVGNRYIVYTTHVYIYYTLHRHTTVDSVM